MALKPAGQVRNIQGDSILSSYDQIPNQFEQHSPAKMEASLECRILVGRAIENNRQGRELVSLSNQRLQTIHVCDGGTS